MEKKTINGAICATAYLVTAVAILILGYCLIRSTYLLVREVGWNGQNPPVWWQQIVAIALSFAPPVALGAGLYRHLFGPPIAESPLPDAGVRRR
jgi:hypothetical protein